MSELNNQTIRGYELREQIGAGGFGEVYRAYQQVVDREVAIKIILPEHANQPQFIRSFETEAQLVARLEHPYIVPLYDYWRDPNGAFLVMRWLRGGNLTQLIRHGPLAIDRTVSILDHLTAALSTAHRANVVHRDLKPDNILLDEEGNAYLSDFGISKAAGHQTTDEGISGSLRYIAPEQLRGLPPNPQVDIYSLGMMLYEILAGEHPFEGSPATKLIQHHLNDPLPDISTKRDDLPSEIDDIIQKATAKDGDERYSDVRMVAIALQEALTPNDVIQVDIGWDDADIINPYKGLRAFQEADASDFFGREALVSQLIGRLRETVKHQRFLAVVGPSGSGKSSAVRAGLIPSLWSNIITNSANWFISDMVPGIHPLRQLENALMRVATKPPTQLYEMLTVNANGLLWATDRVLSGVEGDLLLFIDQFEELFTLTEDDEERDHFLDLLYIAITAPDSRLRIVIAMRADFMDRPLEYPEFGELLKARTEFVLPLSADEIGRAIGGPANRVGVQVDADLIAAIVSDIREEPGALPLLQYALTEVFERREGRHISANAYHDSGGVLGALARRAEEVFINLNESQQTTAWQTFLRLITLGEGKEDTRRRAHISELMSVSENQAILQTILDEFGRFRLLTFDSDPETREPTVEVAHEALIREWDRLQGWLDVSRDDVRLERLLAAAASEWEKAGKDSSYLLSGSRLTQYEEWIETTELALTDSEQVFLGASLSYRKQLEEEERLRQAHEAELEERAGNRLRLAVAILTIGVIVSVGLSIFALNRSQVASANALTSEANAVVAQERGTAVAGQVETVVAAQETAIYEADNASTQENIAQQNAQTSDANAIVAQNNASTAEFRATEVAQQVDVAQAAQNTAIAEADNASTQENIAQQNALTSDANAQLALD